MNTAIRDLIIRGRLNATSVMVVSSGFTPSEARALSILNSGRSRTAIGLHLTLTEPFGPLTGGFAPVRAGTFPSLTRLAVSAFLRRLDLTLLAAEIEAQLLAFVAAFNRVPDFIDGHQHVHLLPQIRDEVLAAAKRHAPAAWVRQCASARPIIKRPLDGKALLIGSLSRSFRARANAMGIATNPAFAGTYNFFARADFAKMFVRFLDQLPDGGLIMCHPGRVTKELERNDRLTHLREREYAYLSNEEFGIALTDRGVVLSDACEQMRN